MRIRDVDLAVERHGSGQPFLWCHGLSSSMRNEDERGLWSLAGPVNATGHELIRYDARGHGRSEGRPVAEDYTWANLALDALALRDAVRSADHDADAPWVLGGASMGAATTLHAAVLRPDLVRAMVLVIPPTAWETRRAQREIYEGAATYIRERGKDAYVAASARLPILPIFAAHPELARATPDISEPLLPIVFEGAAISDFPPEEKVRALQMPTLILAWETDPGHPVSTADRLAALLPQAQVSIAPDVEAIRRWPEQIAAFLRTL